MEVTMLFIGWVLGLLIGGVILLTLGWWTSK